MNPDNWLYIGALTTIMLGGTTVIVTLTNRTTMSAIHGLEGKLGGRIDALEGKVNGRIDGLEGEVRGLRGEMNARFEAVNTRMDSLDRDVAALVKRAMD